MLRGMTRTKSFQSNSAFFLALNIVFHALVQVHELTTQPLDLRSIGCHHNLKLRWHFLACGLWIIKLPVSVSSSSTPHRRDQGDYRAPECEDLED